MDNSFQSNGTNQQSKPTSSLGQHSSSGSYQQLTGSNTKSQILTINQKLNKFMLTSQQLLLSQKISDVFTAINQLILLSQKINLLKNNNKSYDRKLQMLCLYNISCGYQVLTFNKAKANAIEQCLIYLQKSIEINERLIVQNQKYWFKLTYFGVRMNLQYCALLSQIDSHEKALQISVKTLQKMRSIFIKGYQFCNENLTKDKITGQQTVSFTQNVMKKARQLLQNIKNTQKFEEMMDSSEQLNFKRLKENNYFWQSNFENNQKILRKQLNNNYQNTIQVNNQSGTINIKNTNKVGHIPNRNILGLKVSNQWITTFTIGKIMHMKPINYQNYVESDNIAMQFTYRQSIQKVFLISAIYFSIATEMRFLEGELNNKNKKYSKSTKDQMKKSEIFHLKSIQIICKHVKDSSSFTDHLINSYHRHYHNSLSTIEEEPSFTQYSIMSCSNLKKKQPNNLKNSTNGIMIIRGEYNENRMIYKKDDKQKVSPKMVFNKQKKEKNMLQSMQLSKDFSKSTKDIMNRAKNRARNRFAQNLKKSEKSISSTHIHSMRSADKKSFSIQAKSSVTFLKPQSPSPSFKLPKSKLDDKSVRKKSNLRLHTRR